MAKFAFVEWLIGWIERQDVFSFDWDEGNASKSRVKHGISCEEAESVFGQVGSIRVLGEQIAPKTDEPRYGLLGSTVSGKPVFLCFTIRVSGVRIISVRELNKKERDIYDELREE